MTVTVTNDSDYKLLIDLIGLSQTNTVLEKVSNRSSELSRKLPDFTSFSEILPVSVFSGFKILSV